METVLITGGTGLVGTKLTQLLQKKGYKVAWLSRKPTQKKGDVMLYHWDINKNFIEPEALQKADYIVHLAGANVADGRWTEDRKKAIRDSRLDTSNLLYHKIKEFDTNIKGIVAASAIGYYGFENEAKSLNENADAGHDFLADVTVNWEKATDQYRQFNIPTAQIRVGVVLSDKGGALPTMSKPIKLMVGAPLGSGKQFVSWIHLDDLCRMFIYALENKLDGPFNGCAPNPVTNKTLTKSLGKSLNKPVFLPNVPGFLLKIIIGEMAQVVLGSNRCSSSKIQTAGFTFNFPELDKALDDLT